jgi:uncharacterized protein YjbI with pentapeptide repeats
MVALLAEGPKQSQEQLAELVRAEGGEVVRQVTRSVDYLVLAPGYRSVTPPAAKLAEQLNRTQGASIQILTERDLYQLLAPTRDESEALLRAGPEGVRRWNRLTCSPSPLDLTGIDLRGARLQNAQLQRVRLDGADLREADLSSAAMSWFGNALLDGASLVGAYVHQLVDCSLRGADLTEAQLCSAELDRCDFTGARLRKLRGEHLQTEACVFQSADLRGAILHSATFHQPDFRDADLGGATLTATAFHLAKLTGASLVKANLTDADLKGADLRGAALREAVLVGADLRGALIDGADFTGANVSGARLDGLDPSEARGLDPARAAGGGKVGPNIRKLEKIAGKSKHFQTGALIELKEGTVELRVRVRGKHRWISTEEKLPHLTSLNGSHTLRTALIDLARKWTGGTLRLDAVTAKASNCPLKPPELLHLATAAWCEAVGAPPPTPEETAARQQNLEATRQELHQRLLTELRSGAAGVRAWNRLTLQERKAAGDFRRADLSGADLSGVDLQGLDFERANFGGRT